MNETDNLCLTISFLWLGVFVCFAMKWFRYFVSADVGMSLILLCFTALAIRHNIAPPQISPVAAAATPLKYIHVTRDGDGFYHSPDCERLLGATDVKPYDAKVQAKHACVDCVLPSIVRLAKAKENRPPPR